jgi:hypothetical protein
VNGLFTMDTGVHELGAFPATVDDVIAVVINRNEGPAYISGSGENQVYNPTVSFPSQTLIGGKIYFARPQNSTGGLSTSSFTLHATPEDAVTGANVLDFGAFSSGTPYLQYFRLADRKCKGCAVVPIARSGQNGEYTGIVVQWHTPPSSANYTVVFTDNDPAHTSIFRITGQDTNYVYIGPITGLVGNSNWGSAFASMRVVGIK